METPLSVLNKYWKHGQFRPMQEEIISSVLAKRDTLALLPTGGGKSVCFQVPTMLMEGVCIVVTPLIALMKDQVEQLKRRGILAHAIHSGMRREHIDILLDNCVYGPIKFLYISPERIQTELFQERFKKMNVSLIAVDEAHCISQWGYDFRPPYLKITTLRELKPDVPIIALTATATKQVCIDIVEKLNFRDHSVFQKTFARPNLSFVVRKTDGKEKQLLNILKKVKGSGIIYVRSRKSSEQLSNWLTKQGFDSIYYHAGLDFEKRMLHQDTWMKNKARVIVATNAFGMGIDKLDVRFVIHMDIPENLESYYQEAGRAGRDEKRAYAVMIYQNADVKVLEQRAEQASPSIEFLKQVYQALANFYQLAEGSSEGESFDFDISQFCDRFNMHPPEVFNALKKMEEHGILQFNESFYSPSLLHLAVDQPKLYKFQIANATFDPVIKMLLRLYGGELFSGFVKISESYLAKALKLTNQELMNALTQLHQWHMAVYQTSKDSPQITFVMPRLDAEKIPINRKKMEERKGLLREKMLAMKDYIESEHRCRTQIIQNYFNESTFETCGVCDVCLSKKKRESQVEMKELRKEIVRLIEKKPVTIEQLEETISPTDANLYLDIVRELLDEEVLEYDPAWKLVLKRSAK